MLSYFDRLDDFLVTPKSFVWFYKAIKDNWCGHKRWNRSVKMAKHLYALRCLQTKSISKFRAETVNQGNPYPLISIICTLYNYKKFLPDLINSVLSQSYNNWELIIVDDASVDNPETVLKKYRDSRIHYLRIEKNQGYAHAKNEGIIKSSGDYIVMIDADDYLTNKSLEHRYNILAKKSNLWIHGMTYYQNAGETKKVFDQKRFNKYIFFKFQSYNNDEYNYKYYKCIHSQSVMVKKEFHIKLGLYDEGMRASADKEMWLRALLFGYIPAYCSTPVAVYRIHEKQMHSSLWKKSNKYLLDDLAKYKAKKRYDEGINNYNTRLSINSKNNERR